MILEEKRLHQRKLHRYYTFLRDTTRINKIRILLKEHQIGNNPLTFIERPIYASINYLQLKSFITYGRQYVEKPFCIYKTKFYLYQQGFVNGKPQNLANYIDAQRKNFRKENY